MRGRNSCACSHTNRTKLAKGRMAGARGGFHQGGLRRDERETIATMMLGFTALARCCECLREHASEHAET
eukprot:4827299-Pleurochrysis_carterae.AAC.1